MKYNPQQEEAIRAIYGPVLVVAGPGSGKTQVLTARLHEMIGEGIDPSSILVFTFSRKAAIEMRARYESAYGLSQMTFGTFHSVCFQILKEETGITNSDLIIAKSEKINIVRSVLRRYRISYDSLTAKDAEAQLVTAIDLYRNTESLIKLPCRKEIFLLILNGYEDEMQMRGQIDFDGILTRTKQLLEQETILHKWQEKWKFVLVDEFQDLNRIQYDIVRHLFQHTKHIFAVGDDDQSIYGFRGAQPGIMKQFVKDYPAIRQIFLTRNYRSASQIIVAAGTVIFENKLRFEKDIVAEKTTEGDVCIREFADQYEEGRYILQQIRAYQKQGVPLCEMAVLSRSSYSLRILLSSLYRAGIPYLFQGDGMRLKDQEITQDILSYLKLSKDEGNAADLVRIINKPQRHLTRAGIDTNDFSIRRWLVHQVKYGDEKQIAEAEHLIKDLKRISKMSLYGAVNYILYTMGYWEEICCKAMRDGRKEEYEMLVDQILGSIREQSLEEWLLFLDAGEENIHVHQDAVIISSIHASKGLEYEVVFLPDLNEKLLPHSAASTNEEIEEERRLLYVGMTRAKTKLHLMHVQEFRQHKAMPSRFLNAFRTD